MRTKKVSSLRCMPAHLMVSRALTTMVVAPPSTHWSDLWLACSVISGSAIFRDQSLSSPGGGAVGLAGGPDVVRSSWTPGRQVSPPAHRKTRPQGELSSARLNRQLLPAEEFRPCPARIVAE